ncbi:YihY/virulence factor BrkB family protein [Flexistipes sp.]|uniref:YihY/virulence factor BrkB family protein n=1 Tax=Flexistipes sp. TaxID=3088135 RepID=UPI002E24E0A1|nr:YhjD/YihY/BrkB family envelope integrity protein [Flexistipes sp.]
MSKRILARIYLSVHYFFANKLMNFAANLTFFFLLSFIPMLLIISVVLTNLPVPAELASEIFKMIKSVNPDLIGYILKSAGDTQVLTKNALNFGIFGGISLFFTSLLFVRAMKAAFSVIFSKKDQKWGFLSFFIPVIMEILALVMLIAVIMLKIAINVVTKFFDKSFLQDFILIINILENIIYMPIVILLAISWLSYLLMSRGGMSSKISLYSSIGFCVSLYFLNIFFTKVFNMAFYSLIYGSLGTLIFGLLWIYVVFCLYLFWGEFGYVFERVRWITVKMYIESKITETNFIKNLIQSFLLPDKIDKIRIVDKETKIEFGENEDFLFVGEGMLRLFDKDEKHAAEYNKGSLIKAENISGYNILADRKSTLIFLSKNDLKKLINESRTAGDLLADNFIE